MEVKNIAPKEDPQRGTIFIHSVLGTTLPWLGVILAIIVGKWQENPNLTYAIAIPCIVFYTARMLNYVLQHNYFVVDGKTVVITGGSQGMGKGLAKLLSRKGANVVIVARNAKNLEDALQYISAVALRPERQRFHFISADVTVPEENSRIIKEVTAWNKGSPPDIVWANAGMSIPSLFLDASVENMRAQMDINYWSVVYLAQATLRAWIIENPEGANDNNAPDEEPLPRHFVSTSSSAAFCGVAGYSPYSPSKAALRSLHDNLRSEMNLYNGARSHPPRPCLSTEIEFHAVFPGTILSPGLEKENETKHAITKILEEGDTQQTGDEVAMAAVKELEKGRRIITTQLLASAMRASSMQGSPRDRWLVDTLFSWLTNVVWIFVAPDMEKTIWKWGAQNGLPAHV